MSSWDGLNRRRFPRVTYPCMITLRHDHGEPEIILTHTENLGVGGVCVIINKALKMFSPLGLELDLLDGESHIKCEAKVVWAVRRKMEEKKKPLFYDVGIEFINISAQDQKRLDEIVKRLVKLGAVDSSERS